jgi:hypothetical protein
MNSVNSLGLKFQDCRSFSSYRLNEVEKAIRPMLFLYSIIFFFHFSGKAGCFATGGSHGTQKSRKKHFRGLKLTPNIKRLESKISA